MKKFYLLLTICQLFFVPLLLGGTKDFNFLTFEEDTLKVAKNQEEEMYNLFLLSKYVSKPDLAESYLKETIFNQIVSQLGEEKIKYILEKENSLTKKINSQRAFVYDFLFRYLNKSEVIPTLKKVIIDSKGEEAEIKKEYAKFSDSYFFKLIEYFNKRGKIKDTIDGLEDKIKKKELEILKMEEDTVYLKKDLESLKLENLSKTEDLSKINIAIDSLSLEIAKRYVSANPSILNNKSVSRVQKYSETHKPLISENHYFNTITSYQSTASSGLNIPSEAQMIEAVAIFLANRAKQETAIWFMDKVREQMNSPLVQDVFPATIKLLTSLEDYKVPNFGVEWRYAIAKDYVKMPENLVNSPWIKNRVEDRLNERKDLKYEDLKSVVLFTSQLNQQMAQDYTYRDIIRNMYLKNEMDTAKDELPKINRILKNNIKLLYILTNELFILNRSANGESINLINYEQFSSLTQSEWETFLELIYYKYFLKLDAINNDDELRIFNDLINKRYYATQWGSSILSSLTKFDKIRTNFKAVKEKSKDDLSKQNFYTVWQTIHELVSKINISLTAQKNSMTAYVDILNTSLSIYEAMQSKDFRAATQHTFDLIAYFNANQNASGTITYNITPQLQIEAIGETKLKLSYKKPITTNTTNTTPKDRSKNNDPTKEKSKKTVDSIFIIEKKESNVIIRNENNSIALELNNLKYILPLLKNIQRGNQNFKDVTDLIQEDKLDKLKSIAQNLGIKDFELFKLISLAEFLQKDSSLTPEKIKDHLGNFEFYVKSKILESESVDTKQTKKIDQLTQKYSKQLLNLTSFFSDVLAADNEHKLADVIDSHALPPTSYKLKRRVKRSIDLNGYVGGYAGYLHNFGTTPFKDKFVVGLTAPVGVTVTWNYKNSWIKNWGLSFDIVDLGNLVSHYLITSDKYKEDVNFLEVFSPSISVLAGIKNSPFAFYIGGKLTPYKTITIDNHTYNNNMFDTFTISAGIKIDIPIINFQTKEFK